MSEFLRFFDSIKHSHGFALTIYYSSIVDWHITIGYKATHPKCGEYIINIQESDIELCFAKAQVQLKEWLLNNEGGY